MVVYASFIFLLSSVPNPPHPDNPAFSLPLSDKIAHFIIYFIFGLLLYVAFMESAPGNAGYLTYLSGTIYAFFFFFYQYFIPNRFADTFDFIADALALAVAAYLLSQGARKKL